MKSRKQAKVISQTELRRTLRAVIEAAKAGQTYIVTSYGRPDCTIGPIQ